MTLRRRNPIAKAVKKIRPKVVPDTKRKKLEAARRTTAAEYIREMNMMDYRGGSL